MNFMIPYSKATVDGGDGFYVASCRRDSFVGNQQVSNFILWQLGDNTWKTHQEKALEGDNNA
jgi:hypothetical protein